MGKFAHLILGRRGEKKAARYCRRTGYKIVARNYSCPVGEIDLVVLDNNEIVFVEVKTQADRSFGEPEEKVNREKRNSLSRAAQYFLRETGSEHRPCRFDVITVVRHGRRWEIQHLPDFFAPP
jgi:putative endonuclease